jgi:hypothetical protein
MIEKGTTMRLRRWFRPSVSDYLESRAVPSVATVALPPAVLGQVARLPPQVPNGDQVQAAFDAFARNLADAVHSVLLGPGPDGSIDPSANRQAFDETVGQALTSLANQLVQSLGNVPLNSPEVAQIVDAIIGDGPNSLESQLLGLSTEAIVQDVSSGSLTGDSLRTIAQTAAQVTQTVSVATVPFVTQAIVPASPTVPLVGNDNVTIDTSSEVVLNVRNAFSKFMNDYFQTLKDVLMPAGKDGTVDPAAHRSEFDAKVASSLQSLINEISEGVASSSTASGQIIQFREEVVGDDPGSLKNQLAALATPPGPEAAAVRDFTLGSFRSIVSLFTRITGDLSANGG